MSTDDDFWDIVGTETDSDDSECIPGSCLLAVMAQDSLFELISVTKAKYHLEQISKNVFIFWCQLCKKRKRITIQHGSDYVRPEDQERAAPDWFIYDEEHHYEP